jgi:hypothetical protein
MVECSIGISPPSPPFPSPSPPLPITTPITEQN